MRERRYISAREVSKKSRGKPAGGLEGVYASFVRKNRFEGGGVIFAYNSIEISLRIDIRLRHITVGYIFFLIIYR